MAIISSSLNKSNDPRSNKELKVVGSKEIDKLPAIPNHNSARPNSLKEFIGHEYLKDSLKIAIDAAIYRKECLDHLLFYGQPGLGKTTLALLMAKEMGTNSKITNASSIERPRDIVGLLLGLKEGEILFIDEIHRLNRLTEEILYSAMEDFRLDLTMGANKGTRCRTINLPKFTLIGATTKLASISSPLRDRFGICQKISLYSVSDLQKIVLNFAKLINIDLNQEASLKLAQSARGTPRIALRLLKRVRDYAQVLNSNNCVSKEIVAQLLQYQQIDNQGLDETDRKFLFFLRNNNNGPVGLDSIAAGLGEDSSMLEFIIEPYLIQLGFISRTPRGRILTLKGDQYLMSLIEVK
tara:strand:- start:3615 stop:4673 length:1059 start_codon:yes stop_codon:yes gene_type:complete